MHARIRGSFLIEICWSILHYAHLILFCIPHILTQPTWQKFFLKFLKKPLVKGTVCTKNNSLQLFSYLHVVANPVILSVEIRGEFYRIFTELFCVLVHSDPKLTNLKNREAFKSNMVPQVGCQ